MGEQKLHPNDIDCATVRDVVKWGWPLSQLCGLSIWGGIENGNGMQLLVSLSLERVTRT